MENLEFVRKKYTDLNKSPEVESAARRTEARTGEYIPLQDPGRRIENYLGRLREIIDAKDPEKRMQGIAFLKEKLYQQFVIKPEEIPESYFLSIKRRHRDEGYGEIDLSESLKKELGDTLIAEQRDSLDTWIDYLASDNAKYPDPLKYWAMRSILKMGRYDKEKKKFTDRSGGAVSPFPDLNEEALSLVFEAMENKYQGQAQHFDADIKEGPRQQFLQALEKNNFSELYALAIEDFNPIAEELLKITEGQWVKYPRGSDPAPLVASLRKKGTGWCIAGKPTAKRYLGDEQSGGGNDLEIFYSLDEEGNPTIPRVAIASADGNVSEVRGVAEQQNLDPYIGDVVEEKIARIPGGASYKKKDMNMKTLTAIDRKASAGEELTREDLVFLYELKTPIEGFGYKRDPRIAELRAKRDPLKDMPIIFACAESQIATNSEAINADTKAYVGKLQPGIFDVLQKYNVEYIYTSFPEGKIRRENIEIGGKDDKELEREIRDQGIQMSPFSENAMRNGNLPTLKNAERIDLIRLTVEDIGFNDYPTTDELYGRAEELGLELCPAEVGPHYRLIYNDQPINEQINVGMEPIMDPNNQKPYIFSIYRVTDRFLYDRLAKKTTRWNPDDTFLFRLRTLKNVEA